MTTTEEVSAPTVGEVGDALLDALSEFRTADAIANYLDGQGIKGEPGCGAICPIAVLLERELSVPVTVGTTIWQVTGIDVHQDGADAFARNSGLIPPAVAAFIHRFDQGRFPALIVPGAKPRAGL